MEDGLRVSVPVPASNKNALDFIYENKEEILKKQRLIRQKKEANHLKIQPGFRLRTFSFEVSLSPSVREVIHFKFTEGNLTIEHPASIDFEDKVFQEHCWNGIVYFMRYGTIFPQHRGYLHDTSRLTGCFRKKMNSINTPAYSQRYLSYYSC